MSDETADRDRGVTGKTMVYDGDCPMCKGISAAFVRLGMFPESERRPYQAYEGELATRLWEAEIRNEIVILDSASGEIRSGAAGILWMLGSTWVGPVARVLAIRPLSDLVTLGYRLFAYNRRFVSVPRPMGIACACDPDEKPGYQVGFIALASIFAAAVVASAFRAWNPDAFLGRTLALEWSQVLLAAIAVASLPRPVGIRYLGHLAATAAYVAAFALPTLVLAFVPGTGTIVRWLLGLTAAFAVVWAMRAFHRRVAYLELSMRWYVGFVLAVVVGVAGVLALGR
ncbi:MAG: hypothetical protein O7B99_10170 [Planctomycetota bacterium]|nr:hypothetical protein [Planctomycetota bacterium]